jgi:ABC-2 type transport system permease protein
MSNPSNVMMVSNLIRLPLIFVSGIFIPLAQLGSWRWTNEISPLTYLVDLFNGAITNTGVYPPLMDIVVLGIVIVVFVAAAKLIQQYNLSKGI